jgi:hypothetical protein
MVEKKSKKFGDNGCRDGRETNRKGKKRRRGREKSGNGEV